MNDLHFDSVGWPQEPLPVRFDPAPMHGPFFPATERRLECREANAKWLLIPGNREKARRSKAAHKARLRVARKTILAAATAASTSTIPGAKP